MRLWPSSYWVTELKSRKEVMEKTERHWQKVNTKKDQQSKSFTSLYFHTIHTMLNSKSG